MRKIKQLFIGAIPTSQQRLQRDVASNITALKGTFH
jgi:hypothetical protein